MAEEEAVHLANLVWNYWKSIGAKPKMTWVELKHVAEHFLKECKRRGIDPKAVDFQHEICEAGLSYKEHLKKVDEVLDMYAVKPPEAYEVALEDAEKALREAGKYVLEAKEYEELKRLADKAERLERRVEALEREAERERAARAEAERKLEEEKAKFKPLKIRFLRDLPPWYRKGAVIETVDIPWALELIDKGIVERVPVEVAIPTAPPAPAKPPPAPPPKLLPEVVEKCPIDGSPLSEVTRVPIGPVPIRLSAEEEYLRARLGLPIPEREMVWLDVPVTMKLYHCQQDHLFERDPETGRLVQRTPEYVYRKILRETAALRRITAPPPTPAPPIVYYPPPPPRPAKLQDFFWDFVERVKGLSREEYMRLSEEEKRRVIDDWVKYMRR